MASVKADGVRLEAQQPVEPANGNRPSRGLLSMKGFWDFWCMYGTDALCKSSTR